MSTSAQQQRCVALTGRCYEIEGTPPFIPFVEIIEHYARVAPLEVLRETLGDAAPEVARLVPDLRRLFPDMPPPLELPPQQQRHYLFKNVAEFLERVSRVSSIVLLLNDLQWADAATLLLLQHLAPLLGQLPLLALGTYRDVELDVSRPFASTLRQFNDALSIQDEADQRQAADLRYKRGQALRSVGRWKEAIDEWKRTLSIYEELGDRPATAAICVEMAYLLVWTNQGTEAAGVAQRGLEVLGQEASADRCLLLAIGGWGLGVAAERSDEVMAADEMLFQAIAMAEALGDPRAHGVALFTTASTHWFCMRRPEQADTALRAAELLRSTGDLWNMADALALFQLASVFRGRLEGVARFEEETEDLVHRLGHLGANTFARMARVQRDWMLTADLDKYEASVQGLVEVGTRAQMPWVSVWEIWLALWDLWRGRWEAARDRAEDTASREPPGSFARCIWSVLFLCESFVGNKDALAQLDKQRSRLPLAGRPNTTGAWTMLVGVIEGLAVLREQEAAAELYPLACEAIGTGSVVSWGGYRLLETVAGIAAAAGMHWQRAETHYQTALSQARAPKAYRLQSKSQG